MGLQIGNIVPRKGIDFSELKGKKIAVDAFNTIFQFLSTIRQPDGTPLMDRQKRVTSHLSGLFYRNINLMKQGLKLIYVFDGKTPRLKGGTQEKRQEIKEKAFENYEKAVEEEDVGGMGKFSRQLSTLTPEMLEESKELLLAMGIPVVQAPGEGEAEASFLAFNKRAYAVGSQDYDSLLFSAPVLIQNLTLASKRKTPTGYVSIGPEMIELERVLNSLQIDLDQLICLGILCGTDYNPGGIKGIGPKKALDIVKKEKAPALIFKQFPNIDFNWQEVFELFKRPDVRDEEIVFPKMDKEKVKKILLEHDFSEDRINSALQKLEDAKEEAKQTTLF
ncbi:flap endonuclease-1 [Candidatus Pacearchaeota archaeon RBG_13_36_9]|nr:MAG: flap endonuclease-1 [Candidatus Pacearchaeota archaeon RBG_13_36_9]